MTTPIHPDTAVGSGALDGLTFEQFAAMRGHSRQTMGDPGLHRSSERQSEKQWQRLLAPQRAADVALVEARATLREEYAAKVASGEIKAPSLFDRLFANANGHPDIQSTQAARRLLASRFGIDHTGAALARPSSTPSDGDGAAGGAAS